MPSSPSDGPAAPDGGVASPSTTRAQADALRLWVVLARSYHSFTKLVANDLARHGLTTPQFGVMEVLYHLGPLTLGDLADKLLVTGGNITYVMDRLERDGMVSRVRCDQDRRVVRAELTPQGRALIDRIFPAHAEMIENAVSVLPESERREVADQLKRLGLAVQAQLITKGD